MIIVVLAAACSGGDDSDASSPTTTSKSRSTTTTAPGSTTTEAGESSTPAAATVPPPARKFIDTADGICAETNTRLTRLKQTPFATYLRDGAAILDRELAALKEVHPPKAGEDEYQAYLTALGHFIDEVHSAADLAAKGDDAGAHKAFDATKDSVTKAREAARAVGLGTCGSA